MVKRYEMDSEQWEDFIKTVPREETDGNFVYYTDHVAEVREVLEALNREHEPNCFGRVGYDVQPMVCSACNILDKYRGYLDKGE